MSLFSRNKQPLTDNELAAVNAEGGTVARDLGLGGPDVLDADRPLTGELTEGQRVLLRSLRPAQVAVAHEVFPLDDSATHLMGGHS